MAAEDLSEFIDVDALARLLATPAFDVEACREKIATYVRDGDGDAGRGIEKIAGAFKAHAGGVGGRSARRRHRGRSRNR